MIYGQVFGGDNIGQTDVAIKVENIDKVYINPESSIAPELEDHLDKATNAYERTPPETSFSIRHRLHDLTINGENKDLLSLCNKLSVVINNVFDQKNSAKVTKCILKEVVG